MLGLSGGAFVWAMYVVQASTLDWLFWDVTVIPVLIVGAVAALLGALWKPQLRALCVGAGVGAVATIPIVLAAFLALFAVFNLE